MSNERGGGGARAKPWSAKPHHVFHPGDVVDDRYHVMKLVAAGGMAEVYEVYDIDTNERLALKTLNVKYADRPRIVTRLVREARALGELRNPGLVRVVAAGTSEERFYLVMELLDGFTLEQLMHARPTPVGFGLSMLTQIAQAVHVLHGARTIHRDLKPENIFVEEAKGKPEHRAVILDLGIAKFFDASTTDKDQTFGTPSYMAPEQSAGDRVDARTDVYAIGLIGYRMLGGVHPMCVDDTPRTGLEWAARHQHFQPLPLVEVAPHVYPLAGALIDRAIAKDPAKRFPSALDFVHQLTAVMGRMKQRGELLTMRLEPFGSGPEDKASGPQPVARVRPPGVPTPSHALPYLRTAEDEDPNARFLPPVAPANDLDANASPDTERQAPRPEAPRVAAAQDHKTPRGTTKMLGPRGTKPHFETPRVPEAREPLPAPPPPRGSEPSLREVLSASPRPAALSAISPVSAAKEPEKASQEEGTRGPGSFVGRWKEMPAPPPRIEEPEEEDALAKQQAEATAADPMERLVETTDRPRHVRSAATAVLLGLFIATALVGAMIFGAARERARERPATTDRVPPPEPTAAAAAPEPMTQAATTPTPSATAAQAPAASSASASARGVVRSPAPIAGNVCSNRGNIGRLRNWLRRKMSLAALSLGCCA